MFGEMLNDFLRDQVIDHCVSKRLRTRLLAEKELNLNNTLEVAAAMEASEMQSELTSRSSVEQVCAVKHNVDFKCGLQGYKGEDCCISKKENTRSSTGITTSDDVE